MLFGYIKAFSQVSWLLSFIQLQTKRQESEKQVGKNAQKNNMLSTYVNMVIHEHLLDLLKILNIQEKHDYIFVLFVHVFCYDKKNTLRKIEKNIQVNLTTR